jgi:citrate lyase subunit beta/citryl-CoA lyase
MLFVPGDNAGMVSTSFVFKPDTIMFDLEDAVSPQEKDSARLLVYQALRHPSYRDIETAVRINELSTEYGIKDLEMAIRGGADIVRLPKTETAADIEFLDDQVTRIEMACGRPIGQTRVMAAIESASGVVNAVSITRASPRMIAIALAGFDYLVDMQSERSGGSEPELFYARAAVLHAARAVGIDAYDVAYGDVNDIDGFLREVMIAKNLGFNGKSLIHPRQIKPLHKAYAPTAAELIFARRVILAAEKAKSEGLGVTSLDGKMIDRPVIAHAELVIRRAEAA